jgi:hypothetical protein
LQIGLLGPQKRSHIIVVLLHRVFSGQQILQHINTVLAHKLRPRCAVISLSVTSSSRARQKDVLQALSSLLVQQGIGAASSSSNHEPAPASVFEQHNRDRN